MYYIILHFSSTARVVKKSMFWLSLDLVYKIF
jgi:hypothetical protein